MTDIVTGNIVMGASESGAADRQDLDERASSDGSYIQTFNNNTPYRAQLVPMIWHPTRSTVLIAGRDSTGTVGIYEVPASGAPSDFILNAAIADIIAFPPYWGALVGLGVDDSGKIYAVGLLDNRTAITLRRFNSDGTFDADFTAPVQTIGAFANLMLNTGSNAYVNTGAGWGAISPDGQYFYTVEHSQNSGVLPVTFTRTILRYDLTAGMACTQIRSYTAVTEVSGHVHGTTNVYHVAVAPDGNVWVSRTDSDRPAGFVAGDLSDTATTTIEKLDSSGTLLQTIDVGAADSDWTGHLGAGGGDDGGTAYLIFSGSTIFAQFSIRQTSGIRTKFIRISSGGTVTVLPNYNNTYFVAGNPMPYAIAGTFPVAAGRRNSSFAQWIYGLIGAIGAGIAAFRACTG
jgi:hypothetical protein